MATMTLAGFIRALPDCKTARGNPRKWRITSDGEIRSGYGNSISCPLAAVAGAPAAFGNPPDAIRQLGIKTSIGQNIWDAADYGDNRHRLGDGEDHSQVVYRIRAQMVKALGLTEPRFG